MGAPIKILVVNPGSTSSKLGLFENEQPKAMKKVDHPAAEIEKFPKILDQYPMRKQVMVDFLKEQGVEPGQLGCVVGRGGLFKPVPSGTFKVCEAMLADLKVAKYGEHASNIGALLAHGFAVDYHIPAFVVDPVVVDELMDVARLSGIREIPRRSAWHALNVNAVIRMACRNSGWNFKEENFVVAHLGGGISVSAISKGRCIDVSNGLEEGPFSPERAGGLPTLELTRLCFSGNYTPAEMKRLLVGKGGLVNYLGTSSCTEVEQRYEKGDPEAKKVFEAMAYQIAKTIGSYIMALKGNVKRVILTGGAAQNKTLTRLIKEWVEPVKPVLLMPGEDELAALAMGGLRVLRDEEKALDYSSIPG